MKRSWLCALAVSLSLTVGCSDDTEKPKEDKGVADATVDGPTVDQGDVDGAADQNGIDTGPAADQLVPDSDPGTPSVWKEYGTSPDKLYDIWGDKTNNYFAVGKGGALMQWDGTSWKIGMAPDKTADFTAVWGVSSSMVVAMGPAGDAYFDGTKWAQGYKNTSSYYSYGCLWGMKTGSYLLANRQYSSSTNYAYIVYRSKTSTSTWSSGKSFSSLASNTEMFDLYGVSDSDVYIVGQKGKIFRCSSSCNSSSATWSVPSGWPSGITSDLHGVFGTGPKDVWVVGNDGLVVQYDGTSWKKHTTGSSTYFQAVWGSSASDVWVVGNPIFKSDESILHWDGTTWKKAPPPHNSTFNAVWGTGAKDVWAVGSSYMVHYDGSKTP